MLEIMKYILLLSLNLLKELTFKDLLNRHFYYVLVGSQVLAHSLVETGNGPNRPNTIDL